MPLTTVIKMSTVDENPGQSQHVVVYSTNSSKHTNTCYIQNRDTLRKKQKNLEMLKPTNPTCNTQYS